MKYFIEFWKRGLDFKGVASRPQYWYAVLFNMIIVFVISIITLFLGDGSQESLDLTTGVYAVIMFIPSISISVRRFHDQNRSGWFYLLTFIPAVGSIITFIFMLFGTVKVNNKWRMYDIQRGYIKDDLFDQPLSDAGKWTYKG